MYLFVVNPASGHGLGHQTWQFTEKLLRGQEVSHRVIFTTQGDPVGDRLKRMLDQLAPKAVVVVGGDGTVNEVGGILAGSSVPLGLIPAGRGNDFALAHRIPLHPEQALKRILEDRPVWQDTADLGFRKMIGFMGAGFDAVVADTVNRNRPNRWLGRLTYGLEAIKALRGFRPHRLELTVDGEKQEHDGVWLVAVTNIPNYAGGMKICPGAVPDDGKLDICLVKDLAASRFLRVFPKVYGGKHAGDPSVHFLRGTDIHIHSEEPVMLHVDGEVVGRVPVRIRVQPKSLMVL
ncbi:diacylglycerol/lipid kinase family protein [Staphylospora marina]|uniref:diacylglycerol/lipid kinase family protein n=1 Tax=Staphylospora marina TaxID=2490858 RepID=UPI000F5BDA33|nr:diacylglycerol kinase family protein [Staphylospora marina]